MTRQMLDPSECLLAFEAAESAARVVLFCVISYDVFFQNGASYPLEFFSLTFRSLYEEPITTERPLLKK